MKLHLLTALSGLFAIVSFADFAQASATRLTYQAPEGCPTGVEFSKALEARGVAAQLAEAPQGLVVIIEQTGAGYTGRLRVEDEQGTTQAREASAATCAEVADAMAAVGALILAPATAEAPPAQPATVQVQTPRAVPPSEPKTADPEPRDFRGTSAIGADARHWQRDVKAGRVHYDLQTSLSVNAGATLGLLPGVWVPRFDLTAVTAPFLTFPGGEQSLVGVMSRLRIGMLGPVSTDISGQSVALSGFDFHLGVCLSPHYDSRGWVLFACAEYGGAMLSLDLGRGEDRRTEEHGYANAGLDFTAQYNFTSWFNAALRAGSQVYAGRKEVNLGQGFGDFDLGGPATISVSAGLGINF